MVDLPNWSPHDAGQAPTLPEHAERPGRLVTVLTTQETRKDGWAAQFVLDTAAHWSSEGARVVVADVGLRSPTLHSALGMSNTEGVGDVVLFGSSVRRVARAANEGGHFFISAGTCVADPVSVLAHERWHRLCNGFLDAGVTLMAFAHDEDEEAGDVLRGSTDVIVLRGRDEVLTVSLEGVAAPVHAVCGPASDSVEPIPPTELGLEGGDPEAHIFEVLEEVLSEELEPTEAQGEPVDREGESEASPPFDEGEMESPSTDQVHTDVDNAGSPPGSEPHPGPAEDESHSPMPEEPALDPAALDEPARGSRNRVLLALVTVLLVIVGAAAAGLVEIPGLSPEVPSSPSPEDLVQVARSVPLAETTLTLTHSVAVGAFQDEAVAEARLPALEAVGGVFGVIAPVRVDGTVFYRVLLGPGVDSVSAEALAERVANETGTDRAGWVVRSTPLAFELGEIPDLEAAMRRVEVLRGLDIPAYALAVDFVDGSTRYRVYAGAYADEDESQYLASHLTNQGLDNAKITTRIGRVP